ncbi:MAG: DUF3618 domain-containing protein, partial [Maioricimonas sp. JB049]
MTTREELENRYTNGEIDRSPKGIHEDIRETRREMDQTIDALDERLRPSRLLDEVLDYFRTSEGADKGKDAARQVRRYGKSAVRHIKRNPIPALMSVAGLAWLLFEDDEVDDEYESEWDDLHEHSGSYVDARTGEPYADDCEAQWKQEVAAWHSDYDWQQSGEEEQTWSKRAQEALEGLSRELQDTSKKTGDRLRLAAAKVVAFSGHKRKEIQSRWRGLREHSGSYVDARTGEPYEPSYGREWQNLAACDFCSDYQWSEEEESNWSEKSRMALEEIQRSLQDKQATVQQKMQNVSARIGEFVGSTRDMSAEYGQSTMEGLRSAASASGERMSEWGRAGSRAGAAAGRRAQSAGRQMKRGGRKMGRSIQDGYSYTQDRAAEAMDEYPLAVGAGVLAAGLLVGLLLPRTRREDEWMGETSDRLIRRAQEEGEEMLERGQQVAARTAEAAMDEAERQGLSPQDVRESMEEAAGEVKERVTE